MGRIIDFQIAYLSWKRWDVFKDCLDSHKPILNLSVKSTVFFQELSQQDILISNTYGLDFLGADENIGIFNGMKKLFSLLDKNVDYTIYLENDFKMTTDFDLDSMLNDIKTLFEEYNVDMIKLRSRNYPGKPIYSKPKEENPTYDESFPYQLESIHWLENPEKIFPNTIELVDLNYRWFKTKQKHQRWSNNALIVKTNFIKEKILPCMEKEVSLDKYQYCETLLGKKLKFNIAGGHGMFQHIK